MKTVNLHKKLLLAYSEKSDGNIDYRYSAKDVVKNNRKAIFKSLKLNPHHLIEGQQIHSDRILVLNEENTKMWRGHNVTGVDGFACDQTDIALMLRVADCVPVVMYDSKAHALGIFHTGWRGAMSQIHVKGMQLLVDNYQTNLKQLKIWLGPCAHQCCFISKDEPKQIKDPDWKPYIKKRKGVWYIDLVGYITDTLKSAGALKKNITATSECSVDESDLFSHTRNLDTGEAEGRFAVIAKLQ